MKTRVAYTVVAGKEEDSPAFVHTYWSRANAEKVLETCRDYPFASIEIEHIEEKYWEHVEP